MDKYFIKSKQIKTVCIIGAGNEGHYFMALIGANKEIAVNVLTSDASNFKKTIESTNVNTGEITKGNINIVSTNPEDVIPGSDMVILTVPHNACALYLDKIYSYIKPETFIGFIPGTGGIEFLTKDFIQQKKCIVFGSQRVPSGTKVTERGSKVNSLGNRKDICIASTNPEYTDEICTFISNILSIKAIPLPNYLNITFTPSNPILHTSRLYGLFHDYKDGMVWESCLSFYKSWDYYSSEVLIQCDSELQECCKRISKYDFKGVRSLKDHYEIDSVQGKNDIERMTNKIQTLKFLKDNAPMCKNSEDKFIPDFSTRYFKEDFPYGLCILRSFIGITGVKCPMIDNILKWYEKLFGLEYFIDGEFCGKDLKGLPLPQNYGIKTLEDIYTYYNSISK